MLPFRHFSLCSFAPKEGVVMIDKERREEMEGCVVGSTILSAGECGEV